MDEKFFDEKIIFELKWPKNVFFSLKIAKKRKKKLKNFHFFEIDWRSFKTYFKTNIWILKISLFDGDEGRHS